MASTRRGTRTRKCKGKGKGKGKGKRQSGGFYPSVYNGILGAKMLAPLIARQMLRMYETSSRKTRRKFKK